MKIEEPLYVVYNLGKTIRNEILNYKKTVFFIYTNDYVTYGICIVECDFQQHKDFVDENHGHVLTGDLRIISYKYR